MSNKTDTYGKLLSVGCDYLRMTWPKRSEQLEELGCVMYDRFEELAEARQEIKERQWKQFHGYGTEKLLYAESNNHVIIQASSHEANEIATRIKQAGISGKCTRFDAQVTAEYCDRDPAFAHGLRERMRQSEMGAKAAGRPTCALYENHSGDTGLTAGARASETYGRAYHAASGGHPEYGNGAWRFEFEYKYERARDVWAMVRSGASLEVVAASLVTGECLVRGWDEPWRGGIIPERPPVRNDHRDDEAFFKWLETQVVPAIQKRVKLGHAKRINQIIVPALRFRPECAGHSASLEAKRALRQLLMR